MSQHAHQETNRQCTRDFHLGACSDSTCYAPTNNGTSNQAPDPIDQVSTMFANHTLLHEDNSIVDFLYNSHRSSIEGPSSEEQHKVAEYIASLIASVSRLDHTPSSRNSGFVPQSYKWQPPLATNLCIEPKIPNYTGSSARTIAIGLFDEAVPYINNLKSLNTTDALADNNNIQKALTDHLTIQISAFIHGSNKIEHVGHIDMTQTLNLVAKALYWPNTGFSDPIVHNQTDCEVLQHAHAFKYMLDTFQKSNVLTEDLIKSTHAILVAELPVHTPSGIVYSTSYAGIYRKQHVAAGNTNFVTPTRVPTAMTRFVTEINTLLAQTAAFDPFHVASWACGEFVNIHPFLDGNGRMCRIILNVLLLTYTGVVCPFGHLPGERDLYIGICARRSAEEIGNGELAFLVLARCLLSFKELEAELETVEGYGDGIGPGGEYVLV